jgi:HNH endonuclease
MQCILRDNELAQGNSPEHILLNALGGRRTTRTAVCSACNAAFGSTIDKALAAQVTVIRNMLQFESGSGRSAHAPKHSVRE